MDRKTFLQIAKDKIEIPLIQRDYAQGRKDEYATKIRKKFIKDLKTALEGNKHLNLDFIYGSQITSKEPTYPLDGQQRLTTLFLLHWYIANKCNIHELKEYIQFSYETRISSRKFCEKLIESTSISLEGEISKNITNQPWFFISWKKDPTIMGMLTMLDEIHDNFKDTAITWEALENDIITFEYLKLEEFKLSDELYMKMNARGKALTEFEIFKAEFIELLTKEHPHTKKILDNTEVPVQDYFSIKTDTVWTDFFWNSKTVEMDKYFLNFFNFFTEMLYETLQKNDKPDNSSDIELKTTIETVYGDEKNIDFLFRILDLCANHRQEKIQDFFNELHKEIPLFDNKKENLLKICYAGELMIGEQLLLFTVFLLIDEKPALLAKPSEQFYDCLRTLRNLIIDAGNGGIRKENLSSQLSFLKTYLIEQVNISDSVAVSVQGFTKEQRKEEARKWELIQNNPELRSVFHEAEDHEYFVGSINFLIDTVLTDNSISVETFKKYSKKAQQFFSKENLAYPYITQRALLLKFGKDILIKNKSNWQFYWDEQDVEWRKVFALKKDTQLLITEFLNHYIDIPLEQIRIDLEDLDVSYPKWENYIAKDPSMLDYCGQGNIRFDNGSVFLMASQQKNGYHVELLSYYYLKNIDNSKFNPFKIKDGCSISHELPCIYFEHSMEEFKLETYINRKQCIIYLDHKDDFDSGAINDKYKLGFTQDKVYEDYYSRIFSNPDELLSYIKELAKRLG